MNYEEVKKRMDDDKGKLCDYCVYEPNWKLRTTTNHSVVGECIKLKNNIFCHFRNDDTKLFTIVDWCSVKVFNSFEECDHFEQKEKIRR